MVWLLGLETSCDFQMTSHHIFLKFKAWTKFISQSQMDTQVSIQFNLLNF
jgi:hypothetical protein